MSMKTTTIGVTVKDHTNQSGIMTYSFDRGWLSGLADFFGWSSAKSEALRDFIESYSYGKVVRSGINNALQFTMPAGYLGTPINLGFDTCDQKAVITLRDTATGAAHTISIPAPKEDIFEARMGDGVRVDPASGAAIAADFSQVLGKTLVFQDGWLIGKK
jgi:hypothetical protein